MMAPDHVVFLLILDSYLCHMMGSDVQRIQEHHRTNFNLHGNK